MDMTSARRFAAPLFFSAIIFLSGCISSSSQENAVGYKRSFSLEAKPPAIAAPAPRFTNLKVLSFKSQPPFEAYNLIVKRANGETATDYYTTWIAAPHELIRVQTMHYLRKAGLFKTVYDSTSGALAPLGLEGTVEHLVLDARTEKPTACITLRFCILDESAPEFTLLWSAEATGTSPVEGSGPSALITAFNTALTQTLATLTRELEKASLPPSNARRSTSP